jgi:hypothetical protein
MICRAPTPAKSLVRPSGGGDSARAFDRSQWFDVHSVPLSCLVHIIPGRDGPSSPNPGPALHCESVGRRAPGVGHDIEPPPQDHRKSFYLNYLWPFLAYSPKAVSLGGAGRSRRSAAPARQSPDPRIRKALFDEGPHGLARISDRDRRMNPRGHTIEAKSRGLSHCLAPLLLGWLLDMSGRR